MEESPDRFRPLLACQTDLLHAYNVSAKRACSPAKLGASTPKSTALVHSPNAATGDMRPGSAPCGSSYKKAMNRATSSPQLRQSSACMSVGELRAITYGTFQVFRNGFASEDAQEEFGQCENPVIVSRRSVRARRMRPGHRARKKKGGEIRGRKERKRKREVK